MGNNPPLTSSLFTSTQSQQIPWSQEFHLLDKQPLNSTYILQHMPTGNSYKVKHMLLNKVQNGEMFRQIELRSESSSPFVVQLEKVQQYTVKGYCSEHEEVFLMFRHVENTLKEEVLNRRFKKERFSEHEIKVLLQSGVKGLSYLQSIGCPPKSLNTSQLLITPKRSILVNDPLLSVGSLLSDTKQRTVSGPSQQQPPRTIIFSIPQEDYPSPQKLLYQNDLIEEYNEWLSALFTFGVIVLEAIFLEPLEDMFYDKGQKKIYYHKVKEKVEEITEGIQMDKSFNDVTLESFKISFEQNYSASTMKSNFVNEIKQDLRRLLSHEPRIRESVYLKYKKTQTNCLFLNRNNKQQQSTTLNGNLQPQYQPYNQDSFFKNQDYTFKHPNNLASTSQFDNQLDSLMKKYSQINGQNNFSNKQFSFKQEYQELNKSTPLNKFRVVSSSMPSKQPLNSKSPFVMPVTSQYLIGNQSSGPSQQKVWHHLGKREPSGHQKKQSSGGYHAQTGFELDKYKYESEVSNMLKDKPFTYDTFTNEFSGRTQLLKDKPFAFNSFTNDSLWGTQLSQNRFTFPLPPTSYPNWTNTKTSDPSGTGTVGPSFHFPSSTISTDPGTIYSTTNLTRSSTSYVLKPSELGVGAMSTGNGLDYEKYLGRKQKAQIAGVSMLKETRNQGHQIGSKFVAYSENFKQYLTQADPSAQIKTKADQQINRLADLQINRQGSSKSTFINFQQWKKLNSSSSPGFSPLSTTSHKNQPLTSLPVTKQLINFPFKQAGSINYDDSHLVTDKESFVIESYGTGIQHKSVVTRVETPISTIQGTNMPNLSYENSLQINHSNISTFRNEGKSFGSVEEDLRELRKFGVGRDVTQKNKPYSSYSSSQNVSVIDKIYDPQVMASNDRKSIETSSNPYQKQSYKTHVSQSSNQPPVTQKGHRNSSQPYLQTPERYPAKYKLNSTIREASCEQSGVNHSGENNESYENQIVYPMTEVAKYRLGEEGRMSEGKFGARSPANNQQKGHKYDTSKHYDNQDMNKHYEKQDNNRHYDNQDMNKKYGSNTNQKHQSKSQQSLNQQPQQLTTHRVILYADNSRYMGQTDSNGQSHGQGTLYYSDGQIAYEGQWLHGDFNGYGKLCNPYCISVETAFDFKDLTGIDEQLKQYEGHFIRDLKQGKGLFRLRNGEVFEGEFWQDVVHGVGKYYCRDGTVVEGVWERGNLKNLVETNERSNLQNQ